MSSVACPSATRIMFLLLYLHPMQVTCVCRRGLYIIGHSATLLASPPWRALLDHCAATHCLFAASPPFARLATLKLAELLAPALAPHAVRARDGIPVRRGFGEDGCKRARPGVGGHGNHKETGREALANARSSGGGSEARAVPQGALPASAATQSLHPGRSGARERVEGEAVGGGAHGRARDTPPEDAAVWRRGSLEPRASRAGGDRSGAPEQRRQRGRKRSPSGEPQRGSGQEEDRNGGAGPEHARQRGRRRGTRDEPPHSSDEYWSRGSAHDRAEPGPEQRRQPRRKRSHSSEPRHSSEREGHSSDASGRGGAGLERPGKRARRRTPMGEMRCSSSEREGRSHGGARAGAGPEPRGRRVRGRLSGSEPRHSSNEEEAGGRRGGAAALRGLGSGLEVKRLPGDEPRHSSSEEEAGGRRGRAAARTAIGSGLGSELGAGLDTGSGTCSPRAGATPGASTRIGSVSVPSGPPAPGGVPASRAGVTAIAGGLPWGRPLAPLQRLGAQGARSGSEEGPGFSRGSGSSTSGGGGGSRGSPGEPGGGRRARHGRSRLGRGERGQRRAAGAGD